MFIDQFARYYTFLLYVLIIVNCQLNTNLLDIINFYILFNLIRPTTLWVIS